MIGPDITIETKQRSADKEQEMRGGSTRFYLIPFPIELTRFEAKEKIKDQGQEDRLVKSKKK